MTRVDKMVGGGGPILHQGRISNNLKEKIRSPARKNYDERPRMSKRKCLAKFEKEKKKEKH